MKREINPEWVKEHEELLLKKKKFMENARVDETFESISKRCEVIYTRTHYRVFQDPNDENMVYWCETTADFAIPWTLENAKFQTYHSTKEELLQSLRDGTKIIRLNFLINVPRANVTYEESERQKEEFDLVRKELKLN